MIDLIASTHDVADRVPKIFDGTLPRANETTAVLFERLSTLMTRGPIVQVGDDDAFRCECASIGYFANTILMRDGNAARQWPVSNKAVLDIASRLAVERDVLTRHDYPGVLSMLQIASGLGGNADLAAVDRNVSRFYGRLQAWDRAMSKRQLLWRATL